jgi:hypothetical protein
VNDLINSYHQLQSIIPIAITAGVFIATLMFTLIQKTFTFIKSQTVNGDGRTLRAAVDDLAVDLTEHRHEIRRELAAINERMDRVEQKGLVSVPHP